MRPINWRIDPSFTLRMEIVTLTAKFEIVIPPKIREAMGLQAGEKIRMLPFRHRMELIPVRSPRQLRGSLKGIQTHFEREGDRA